MTNNTKSKTKPSYKERNSKRNIPMGKSKSGTLALDKVRLPENFVLPQTIKFAPDVQDPEQLTYGDFTTATPRLVQTVIEVNTHLREPDYTTGLGYAAMDIFQKLRVINRANTNYSVVDLYYYLVSIGRIAAVYYSAVLRHRTYSTFNSYMPGLHRQSMFATPVTADGSFPVDTSFAFSQKSFFPFNSESFLAYPTVEENYVKVSADLAQVSNLLAGLPIPTNYGRFFNHLFGNLFLDDAESRNDTYHVCVQPFAHTLKSDGTNYSLLVNPWSVLKSPSEGDMQYTSLAEGIGKYYDYLMSDTGLSTMVMDLYKSGLCSGICQPMTIPEVSCAIEPVYSPGYAMFITNSYLYIGRNHGNASDWSYEISDYMRFDDTNDMRINTTEGAFWATLSNVYLPYDTASGATGRAYSANKGLLGPTFQALYMPIANWGAYDVYLVINYGAIQVTDSLGAYTAAGALATVGVPGIFNTINLAKPLFVLALPGTDASVPPANGLYGMVMLHKRFNNGTYTRKENVDLVAQKGIISLFE